MYAKMLYGKRKLYFRYAPPITDLDGATNDRPNPPFPNSPLYCRSVFYYWWAFLQENEGYMECCERGGTGKFSSLYRDFGDVRGKDFMKWWTKGGGNGQGGRLLFCEPEIGAPTVHLSPPPTIDDEHELLVSIPITGDLERTLAELRNILQKPMQSFRKRAKENGASSSNGHGPRYPVHAMHSLTALHQTLMTWQAKRRLPENATLVEVGREAANGEFPIWNANGEHMSTMSRNKVHRYLHSAERLIHNVGYGRFPDFS